ncbi:MAG: hypothetical protein HFJ75_02490 [Eggerthellaceae bacterium]|nr:hypothetical protein [Eggerthellaceae bacterium]
MRREAIAALTSRRRDAAAPRACIAACSDVAPVPAFARVLAAFVALALAALLTVAAPLASASSLASAAPGPALAWAAPASDEAAPYWISVTYTGDGTAEASARVEPDDSHTVHWRANAGAEVVAVVVDGEVRDDLAGQTSGSVSFSGITADHSVEVAFTPLGEGPQFSVSTTIEGGPGWISGAGAVPRGDSRVVSWQADEGWKVAAVLVDGTARSDLVAVRSTIFQNIAANHSIEVVVAPDESASASSASTTDDGEATLFAQRKAVSPTSPFEEPAEGAPRLVYDLVSLVHAGGMASLVVGVVLFAALVAGAHVLSDRRRYYEEDLREAQEAAEAERAERAAEADAYLAGYYDAYLAAYGEDDPADEDAPGA